MQLHPNDVMDMETPNTPDEQKQKKNKVEIPFAVSHYKIVLDCDIPNKSLAGFVDISLTTNNDLDEINLHCSSQIHVSAVALPGDKTNTKIIGKQACSQNTSSSTDISKDPNDYSLTKILSLENLDFALQERGLLTIKDKLEKHVSRTYRIYFEVVTPQGGVQFNSKQNVMFTVSHPQHARLWFPCIDNPINLSTFDIQITCAQDQLAICTGNLLRQVESPTTSLKTFYFSETRRITTQSVGIVVGPFKMYQNPDLPYISHFYLHHHSLKSLKHINQVLVKSFENLNKVTGVNFCKIFTSYKQVFVDDSWSENMSFATLSVLSSEYLIDETIIDPTIDIFLVLDRMVSDQYFYHYLHFKEWSDLWLSVGFSGWASLIFLESQFGKNEFKYRLMKASEELAVMETHRQPLWTKKFLHPNEIFTPYLFKKSPWVIHMINRLSNEVNMKKYITRTFEASFESENMRNLKTSGLIKTFRKLFTVDLKSFSDFWIFSTGIPTFHCGFRYDVQKSVVEVAVKQLGIQTLFVGNVTVRIHETEGTMDYAFPIEDQGNHFEVPCRSKPKKKARRKKDEKEAVPNAPEKQKESLPIKWIRIDPEFEWLRVVKFEQTEGMWIHQLERDRDVVAQSEAIRALSTFSTQNVVTKLENVVNDSNLYYRIRGEAAQSMSLLKVDTASETLKKIFKNLFYDKKGLMARPNDFSNLPLYFVKKEMVLTVPYKFLREIIKTNDNSENKYSDCFYRCNLIMACVKCPKEKIAKNAQWIMSQLVLDTMIPSPEYMVSASCITALSMMGIKNDEKYWKYFDLSGKTKIAVIGALLRSTNQIYSLISQLLEVIKKESPQIRHKIVSELTEYIDSSRIVSQFRAFTKENHKLVICFSDMIKSRFVQSDPRLRVDMILLYQMLWGSGVPKCFYEQQPIEEEDEEEFERERPEFLMPNYVAPKYTVDVKKRKSVGGEQKKKKPKLDGYVSVSPASNKLTVKLPVKKELTQEEIQESERQYDKLVKQIEVEREISLKKLDYEINTIKKRLQEGKSPNFVNLLTPIGNFVIQLYENETNRNLWISLPIESDYFDAMKGMVYFPLPGMIKTPNEPDQRQVVQKGEIAYWNNGNSICIGFAKTPYSQARIPDILLGGPCNMVGFVPHQEKLVTKFKEYQDKGRVEKSMIMKRPRRLMIEWDGYFVLSIDLYENTTADVVWQSLPRAYTTSAGFTESMRWFAFPITLSQLSKGESRTIMDFGEVVYWPSGNSIILGSGHSKQPSIDLAPNEIALDAPCYPFGRIVTGFELILKSQFKPGDPVTAKVYKRMMRVTIGSVKFIAEILDTNTGDVVYNALPFKSKSKLWGEMLHFAAEIDENIPQESNCEDIVVEPTDLAFWRTSNDICIAWGVTGNQEVGKLQEPCNIFGKIITKDVVKQLSEAKLEEDMEVYCELYNGYN